MNIIIKKIMKLLNKKKNIINEIMDWLNAYKIESEVLIFESNTLSPERTVFNLYIKNGDGFGYRIKFYKNYVYVDASEEDGFIQFYEAEPMILDLLNLLVERNLEMDPNNVIETLDEIRQNIILRLL